MCEILDGLPILSEDGGSESVGRGGVTQFDGGIQLIGIVHIHSQHRTKQLRKRLERRGRRRERKERERKGQRRRERWRQREMEAPQRTWFHSGGLW